MKRFFLLCLLAQSVGAQSTDAPPASAADPAKVKALIAQLADPKARLRDEAQAALGQIPEAEAALQEAAASHPSQEAQLRAKRLLKVLQESLWTMEWETLITTRSGGSTILRGLAASPDGRHLVGKHRGGAEVVKTDSGTSVGVLGNPCLTSIGISGIHRAIAFSPDGKWVASTDHTGSIFIDDLAKNRIQTLPAEKSKRMVRVSRSSLLGGETVALEEMEFPAETWGLAFLPDGKNLLAFSTAGLIRYDLEGKSKPMVPFNELFPIEGYTVAPRAMAVSPDGAWAALGVEVMGSKDEVVLVQVPDLSPQQRWRLPAIPASLAVPDGGKEVLIGLRGEGVHRGIPGNSFSEPLHTMGGWITGLKYAPDGKSAFFSTTVPQTPLRQIALPSGETIWTAPPAVQGYEDVVLAGPGRIAVSTTNCYIQIWKARTSSPPAIPTSR
jgi:WD40 repeat protein